VPGRIAPDTGTDLPGYLVKDTEYHPGGFPTGKVKKIIQQIKIKKGREKWRSPVI
jgi:hypothetical protein